MDDLIEESGTSSEESGTSSEESGTSSKEKCCHRCLQPVPPEAARCPHCGDPLNPAMNVRTLLIAVVGIIIFLGAAFAAVRFFQTRDTPNQDAGSTQSAPPTDSKPALGQ